MSTKWTWITNDKVFINLVPPRALHQGLPSLAETHVDFGVSGKVIQKEEAPADADLPEGEGSSQIEPMEQAGEEPGDNRVGSSSQQEASSKAGE